MDIFYSMLAAAEPSTAEQVAEIHELVTTQPMWVYKIIGPLVALIAVAVILIFLRQKKIAQNQVDTAKLIEELLDKR
jgi:hypothetical protein